MVLRSRSSSAVRVRANSRCASASSLSNRSRLTPANPACHGMAWAGGGAAARVTGCLPWAIAIRATEASGLEVCAVTAPDEGFGVFDGVHLLLLVDNMLAGQPASIKMGWPDAYCELRCLAVKNARRRAKRLHRRPDAHHWRSVQ